MVDEDNFTLWSRFLSALYILLLVILFITYIELIILFYYVINISMSCLKVTAPININRNKAGACDLKCDFQQQYTTSSISAENMGDHIRFILDKSTTPPVTFNTEQYNVAEMELYQPSLHQFGGKNLPGEIIISHSNISNNAMLFICIPIIDSGSSFDTMDALITQVSDRANALGGKTSIRMANFNLNKLVPNTPYYNYKGTLPYICAGSMQYIVFDAVNAIKIRKLTKLKLQKIITPHSIEVYKNPDGLFYNKNGPTTPSIGGDIYIECNPTGDEGKVLVVDGNSDTSGDYTASKNIMDFLNSPVISILLGIIIFLLIIKVFTVLLSKIFGISQTASHVPTSSSLT